MLHMRDDLLEHLGDVVVVQRVNDLAPVAAADDQPEVAHQPRAMRRPAEPSIPTAVASSPTDADPLCRRARIRSRVAGSACIASAAA